MSLPPKIRRWLAERYDIDVAEKFVDGQLHKPLPQETGFWHTFGSLSLYLFLNQVVTGILLMIYYRPTTNTAFESIRFIMTKAEFGWLIRGLHAWGATLMILCVLVHMMRTYFMGAYKKPRELTWVLGVLIFGCTVTFGFTGYLLPWNQLSYWATTVGTEISGAIPVVGNYIKLLLRGGEGVSGETLARFYVLHVVVLPWVLTTLIVTHLFLMRVQGLATMERVGEEKPTDKKHAVPFFPDHVLKEGVVFCALIGVLVTLIVLWPVELGVKADPFVTPEGIKPEWYFLPTYQLLKYFPKLLGIFVSLIPPLLLLLWPFLDRGRERHPKKRPVAVTIGILGLFLAILFGVLGHFSETTITWHEQRYQLDMYAVPHRLPAGGEAAPNRATKGAKSRESNSQSANH
ncbi:MAG TPA: cytochrome bc complex cytochrome b subunit [Verrucomicrobiae bacterium]|nr:cytochrome bc complex cytochrome b subunit [Verrucomicrobiae bacterium]